MEVLIALVGFSLGILLGFFIGFLATKRIHQEEDFIVGYSIGCDYAKDLFFNPQAKG